MKVLIGVLLSALLMVVAQEETTTTEIPRFPDERCAPYGAEQELILLPHHEDCTKFFACWSDGTLSELQCLPDTEFNPEISVCDHPNPDGCILEPLQPPQ